MPKMRKYIRQLNERFFMEPWSNVNESTWDDKFIISVLANTSVGNQVQLMEHDEFKEFLIQNNLYSDSDVIVFAMQAIG